MDQSVPVVIARVCGESEASVIKSLLGSYNIPCFYSSEIPGRFYPIPDDGTGQIRLFVPASLAQEAKHILEEHRCLDAPPYRVED